MPVNFFYVHSLAAAPPVGQGAVIGQGGLKSAETSSYGLTASAFVLMIFAIILAIMSHRHVQQSRTAFEADSDKWSRWTGDAVDDGTRLSKQEEEAAKEVAVDGMRLAAETRRLDQILSNIIVD